MKGQAEHAKKSSVSPNGDTELFFVDYLVFTNK